MLDAVEVESQQGNSKILVSEEGIREGGLRGFVGRDWLFLAGGRGPLRQGIGCAQSVEDMLSGEGERGKQSRQQKERSLTAAFPAVRLQPIDRTGA